MKATIMQKLLNKYLACPRCGLATLGQGLGSIKVTENHFVRICSCGFIAKADAEGNAQEGDWGTDILKRGEEPTKLACIETLHLPAYDEDGFLEEGKLFEVERGSVWDVARTDTRHVGGPNTIRLESGLLWIEVSKETLKTFFRDASVLPKKGGRESEDWRNTVQKNKEGE